MGENVIAAWRLSRDWNMSESGHFCLWAVRKASGSVQHILGRAVRLRLFLIQNSLTFAARG
jgi:hypothetical protein